MSNYYEHDRAEKKERHAGPRPPMPKPNYDYCQMMHEYLEARRLSYHVARVNGWYPTTAVDRSPRIVIPGVNPHGLAYYQARAMDDHKIRYKSPAASRADSIVLVYPAEDGARDKSGTGGAAIFEGPMDALAAAGLEWIGIALMGNEPPDGVLAYTASICDSVQEVVILPDMDHPEMGGYVLGYLGTRGIKARVIIPSEKDFADMSPRQREEILG